MVHHWKETGESDPTWASERDIVLLEKKLLATGMDRYRCTWMFWPPEQGRHEVSFAIELFTLEFHEYTGSRGGADQWKRGFDVRRWLTGTIDWLGWRHSPEYPWVDDLKTGRWPVHPDSKQLLSYLLYPWVRVRCPNDWRAVASITQWPKYPISMMPRRTERNTLVSQVDMIEHLDDLRWSLTHPNEVVPSEDGCRFCDSRPVCPAHQGE